MEMYKICIFYFRVFCLHGHFCCDLISWIPETVKIISMTLLGENSSTGMPMN